MTRHTRVGGSKFYDGIQIFWDREPIVAMACGMVSMTSSVARVTGVTGVLCCGALPHQAGACLWRGGGCLCSVDPLTMQLPGILNAHWGGDLVVLVSCVPAQTKAPSPPILALLAPGCLRVKFWEFSSFPSASTVGPVISDKLKESRELDTCNIICYSLLSSRHATFSSSALNFASWRRSNTFSVKLVPSSSLNATIVAVLRFWRRNTLRYFLTLIDKSRSWSTSSSLLSSFPLRRWASGRLMSPRYAPRKLGLHTARRSCQKWYQYWIPESTLVESVLTNYKPFSFCFIKSGCLRWSHRARYLHFSCPSPCRESRSRRKDFRR